MRKKGRHVENKIKRNEYLKKIHWFRKIYLRMRGNDGDTIKNALSISYVFTVPM